MRHTIAGPVAARAGQELVFSAKLRKGEDYGYVELYSSNDPEFPPSPYVRAIKLNAINDGDKPRMVSAVALRLSQAYPKRKIVVPVDEDTTFYLTQDFGKDERPAIGRIKINGRRERLQTFLAAAARRLLGRR